MGLQDCLTLGFTTAQDALSWLLLAAISLKLASTLLLIAPRPPGWVRRHEPGLWWLTKLSALSACACAALLCRWAGDVQDALIFSVLLGVAVVLVAMRVVRRRAASVRAA